MIRSPYDMADRGRAMPAGMAMIAHDLADTMDRMVERASRPQPTKSTRSAGSAEQAPASD